MVGDLHHIDTTDPARPEEIILRPLAQVAEEQSRQARSGRAEDDAAVVARRHIVTRSTRPQDVPVQVTERARRPRQRLLHVRSLGFEGRDDLLV